MYRFALVLLSLLPIACAVNVSEGSSGDQPGELDDASKPTTPDVSEPVVEAEPPARTSATDLPDCPADADAGTYCTADGKLAGRWVLVDMLRPPTSAQIIFEAKHLDIHQQPSLVILLDGETLYIKAVTCGACRRVMGNGFAGVLTALSDEQLRALELGLGLAADAPLLDSAAAWRGYVDSEPGKTALTELSKALSR